MHPRVLRPLHVITARNFVASAVRLSPRMAAPPPPGAGAARFSGHTIKLFADSLGLGALPDDVAAAQAAEVEYRLRQVIQARVYRLHLPGHTTVV